MGKITFLLLVGFFSLSHRALAEGTHGMPNIPAGQSAGTRSFVGNETPRAMEMTLFDNDAETTEALQKRIEEKLNAEQRLQCPADPSPTYDSCTSSGLVGERDADDIESNL